MDTEELESILNEIANHNRQLNLINNINNCDDLETKAKPRAQNAMSARYISIEKSREGSMLQINADSAAESSVMEKYFSEFKGVRLKRTGALPKTSNSFSSSTSSISPISPRYHSEQTSFQGRNQVKDDTLPHQLTQLSTSHPVLQFTEDYSQDKMDLIYEFCNKTAAEYQALYLLCRKSKSLSAIFNEKDALPERIISYLRNVAKTKEKYFFETKEFNLIDQIVKMKKKYTSTYYQRINNICKVYFANRVNKRKQTASMICNIRLLFVLICDPKYTDRKEELFHECIEAMTEIQNRKNTESIRQLFLECKSFMYDTTLFPVEEYPYLIYLIKFIKSCKIEDTYVVELAQNYPVISLL